MDRLFVGLGALAAMLGVAAGAFGAHALRGRLTPEMASVFETAVRYQLVHAVGLLAVGWLATRWRDPLVAAAGWLFVAGIILFSGSLMVLALSGVRGLGAVTPFGGVAFIAGWACIGMAAVRGGRSH